MRIVATSDTHTPVDPKSIPDGDVFIHAGDLMVRGYVDEWEMALQWLSALPHKTKIFVPGNHDFHLQVYPGPALQDMRRSGVTVLGFPGNYGFEEMTLPNSMTVLGIPFVTNLPRWAFNSTESEINDYLLKKTKADIVVSHSPIKGVLDADDISHQGIGCYMDFLQRVNPKLWFCGHVHDKYGSKKIGKTTVYNLSMCNKDYIHANPPVVIDL